MILYPIGKTKACVIAADILVQHRFTLIDHPSPDITHVLLDVPSFRSDGQLRCGGYIEPILERLPSGIIILGGNLNHPSLKTYTTYDLLQNPVYLANNAAITAECAIRLAGSHIEQTFADSACLIIGWGRIGKCLAGKLKLLGCNVTVAARKEHDRAILQALSFDAITLNEVSSRLKDTSLLFNTVPYPVLETPVPDTCLAIELASSPGILSGNNIPAPGLPGRMAPVSSGRLIAQTILDMHQEGML